MAGNRQKNKILLVGSLPNEDPCSIGGSTTLFKNLIDFCNEVEHEYVLLTANRFNFRIYSILDVLVVYLTGFFKLLRCDVAMVNVSNRGITWIAPYFVLLGKIFNKKITVRVFGGNFAKTFDATKGLRKKVLCWMVKNACILFLETKESVRYFEAYNSNIRWLPNVRESVSGEAQKSSYSKRFIYLGHIRKSKGIDQLLAVREKLSDDFTLHLYGYVLDDEYTSMDTSIYKGVLIKSEDVVDTLRQYDVLVLPTFWHGEGYPGVIIEGYSLGLPCITTRWNAIPEIVDEGKTGLIIEPKSVDDLQTAILHFDETNYLKMSNAAYEKFDEFDSDKVNTELLSLFQNI